MSIEVIKELNVMEEEIKTLVQTITDTRHQVGTMRQEFYETLKRIEAVEAAVEELRVEYGSNKKQA